MACTRPVARAERLPERLTDGQRYRCRFAGSGLSAAEYVAAETNMRNRLGLNRCRIKVSRRAYGTWKRPASRRFSNLIRAYSQEYQAKMCRTRVASARAIGAWLRSDWLLLQEKPLHYRFPRIPVNGPCAWPARHPVECGTIHG